jgi:hypothetical protein
MRCSYCLSDISPEASRCPYCGQRKPPFTAAVVVVGFISFAVTLEVLTLFLPKPLALVGAIIVGYSVANVIFKYGRHSS